ncbi:MAG: cell division protein FtsW, partial [Flavisolibacter sp.]|nr:cell division protein FtsW [Flavisolibacter sp.]
LVSMGGSSFLFTCLSIGIILSVARNVEQLEGKRQRELAQAKETEEESEIETEEIEEPEMAEA